MKKLFTKKNNSKYSEDWIPVKAITNGIVHLENTKEKVTGVKIRPRNIFILDRDYQERIITSLKNFYNTIDYEFWIICADRPVDITFYLSQMQLLYNSTQEPVIRKMIQEDIEKSNMFIENNIVDTEYYLLFKEKDNDLLHKKIRNLINGLASCGLTANQVSNDEIRLVLDNFLNAGSSSEFGTVMPL